MSNSPIEMAFIMARTGQFENFSQVKRALRRNFAVERELVGRQLAADVTRVCREARANKAEAGDPSGPASNERAQAG
jgi:hypothetical protein